MQEEEQVYPYHSVDLYCLSSTVTVDWKSRSWGRVTCKQNTVIGCSGAEVQAGCWRQQGG